MNARNKDTMWTLLHTASHAGQHLVVEALLSAGAKFDTEVEGKYNPLLLCCSCGSEGMVCPVTLALEKEDVEDPARRIECGHVKVRKSCTALVGGSPVCQTNTLQVATLELGRSRTINITVQSIFRAKRLRRHHREQWHHSTLVQSPA